MKQLAFIVFQDNDQVRYIVEAIAQDNPHAEVQHHPAMIRIQAEKRLAIHRHTVEEKIGREWDVQEMLLNVVSIGGNVEETDDSFILDWKD